MKLLDKVSSDGCVVVAFLAVIAITIILGEIKEIYLTKICPCAKTCTHHD